MKSLLVMIRRSFVSYSNESIEHGLTLCQPVDSKTEIAHLNMFYVPAVILDTCGNVLLKDGSMFIASIDPR